MELNRMLNDKNAQSSPKDGKAAVHVYMLSRAKARKRRPEGVNHIFISLIPENKPQKRFLLIMKEGRRQDK